MRTFLLCFLVALLSLGAATTTKKRKKKKAPAPPRITAAQRQAAREEIEAKMGAVTTGIENPSALASYFASLQRRRSRPHPAVRRLSHRI